MPNHLLTIGLNYTGSQNQLAGCLNDARDWHAILAAVRIVHATARTASQQGRHGVGYR